MSKKCFTCAPYIRTALYLLAALWLWGNGELAFHYITHGTFDDLVANAATQIAILGDIVLPVGIVAFIIYKIIRKKRTAK